jgi:hypothetical protein
MTAPSLYPRPEPLVGPPDLYTPQIFSVVALDHVRLVRGCRADRALCDSMPLSTSRDSGCEGTFYCADPDITDRRDRRRPLFVGSGCVGVRWKLGVWNRGTFTLPILIFTPHAARVRKPVATYGSGFFEMKSPNERRSRQYGGSIYRQICARLALLRSRRPPTPAGSSTGLAACWRDCPYRGGIYYATGHAPRGSSS